MCWFISTDNNFGDTTPQNDSPQPYHEYHDGANYFPQSPGLRDQGFSSTSLSSMLEANEASLDFLSPLYAQAEPAKAAKTEKPRIRFPAEMIAASLPVAYVPGRENIRQLETEALKTKANVEELKKMRRRVQQNESKRIEREGNRIANMPVADSIPLSL